MNYPAMILEKIKLPNIIGMLIVGIMLGPSMFNMLDESLLSISGDIKEIALIIILLKAGLSLDLTDLKKVGRPAVLLCFLPATFEILGFIIFGNESVRKNSIQLLVYILCGVMELF